MDLTGSWELSNLKHKLMLFDISERSLLQKFNNIGLVIPDRQIYGTSNKKSLLQRDLLGLFKLGFLPFTFF